MGLRLEKTDLVANAAGWAGGNGKAAMRFPGGAPPSGVDAGDQHPHTRYYRTRPIGTDF